MDTYNLPDRFWAKVDRRGSDECWSWTGRLNDNGYGIYQINRRRHPASRVITEAIHGPLGELFACHTCDNPACVNPAHLFVGTAKDNVQDMLSKGRRPYVCRQRTHCKQGHDLSPDNVYVNPGSGDRSCRKCRTERNKKTAATRKTERHAKKTLGISQLAIFARGGQL